MWALERLNRRTSLPLVYSPAGRLPAVYFCRRCDSSSFSSSRCSLTHNTTLSPFSPSHLSLFYLHYVISLFSQLVVFSQIRPAMCCGSHRDVIYFRLFWILVMISFNRKKSEKVNIQNMSHCDVTKSARQMFSFYYDRKFTGRPNTVMSAMPAILQHASCAALPTAIW